MAISKTRPNSLFALLALTEDGSSVSPRLFRNDATRPGLRRGRRTGEADSESAFPIAPSCVYLANMVPNSQNAGRVLARSTTLASFLVGANRFTYG